MPLTLGPPMEKAETMTTKPRCEEHIFHTRGMSGYRCQNAGRFEHEAKHYCGTHHPPSIAKRRADKEEAERVDREKRIARREALNADFNETRRRAACHEPMVEFLRRVDANFKLGEPVTGFRGYGNGLTFRQHLQALLALAEGKKR